MGILLGQSDFSQPFREREIFRKQPIGIFLCDTPLRLYGLIAILETVLKKYRQEKITEICSANINPVMDGPCLSFDMEAVT